MRMFVSAILIIGIIFLNIIPVCAEGPIVTKSRPNTLYLSLNEALQLAILNNFDVQLNLYDKWIKETDNDKAGSIYDTILTLTSEYNYDRNEQASSIAGTVSHTGTAGAKITKLLPSGTDIAIDFKSARSSSDSVFATMNPSYESTLEMKFTQPLLRNFFGMYDWGKVRITRINVNNFSSEVLDKIEKNLADVEKAYWDVVVEERLVQAAYEMHERAEEFYIINVKKKKIGTAELTDLLAAEANREIRKSELEIEKDKFEAAINKLKLYLNFPDDDRDILPIEGIVFSDRNISLIGCMMTAFENRRDYGRAKDDIKAKKIKFNMEKNARWPKLDLEGSLKLNGVEKKLKDTLADAFTSENPEYDAKITFSFPFEDKDSRSRYNKAKNEKAKSLLKFKKIEKTIVTEINDSVRRAKVYEERAKIKKKIEELQKRKLEEERRQFGYGRSSSDRIIRFQEDLLAAKKSSLSAFKNYKNSIVDLYLTEDTFLTRRNLSTK